MSNTSPDRPIRIAVAGCVHGEVEAMYTAIAALERNDPAKRKIDLVLCCGDFESVRNEGDLASMACPPKYRHMVSFWKYHTGELTAPYPTVFVHGNHEASNHLLELSQGGWVAPNIYFMGFAGVVKFGGLRIAGYGGIYNRRDFTSPRHESSPLDDSSMRSLYHSREYELFLLSQLSSPVDIFLSHDWPARIASHGDAARLSRDKPFFAEEIAAGTLGGNPAHIRLMEQHKPLYWFSAHMHALFPAVVPHTPAEGSACATRFLALDKVVPGRGFLQIIDVPAPAATITSAVAPAAAGDGNTPAANNDVRVSPPRVLAYDEEWLAITRAAWDCYPRSSLPVTTAAAAAGNGWKGGVLPTRHPDCRPPRPDRPVLFVPFDAAPVDTLPAAVEGSKGAVEGTKCAEGGQARWDYRPSQSEIAWVKGRLLSAFGPPLPPSAAAAASASSSSPSGEDSSAATAATAAAASDAANGCPACSDSTETPSTSCKGLDACKGSVWPIPQSFFHISTPNNLYRGSGKYSKTATIPGFFANLQTTAICAILGVEQINFSAKSSAASEDAACIRTRQCSPSAVVVKDGWVAKGTGDGNGWLETDLAAVFAKVTGVNVEDVRATVSKTSSGPAPEAPAPSVDVTAPCGSPVVEEAEAASAAATEAAATEAAAAEAAALAASRQAEDEEEDAALLAAFRASRCETVVDETPAPAPVPTSTAAAPTEKRGLFDSLPPPGAVAAAAAAKSAAEAEATALDDKELADDISALYD